MVLIDVGSPDPRRRLNQDLPHAFRIRQALPKALEAQLSGRAEGEPEGVDRAVGQALWAESYGYAWRGEDGVKVRYAGRHVRHDGEVVAGRTSPGNGTWSVSPST